MRHGKGAIARVVRGRTSKGSSARKGRSRSAGRVSAHDSDRPTALKLGFGRPYAGAVRKGRRARAGMLVGAVRTPP